MICPKCGFDQPDDIYCVFCGVNIEKYQSEKKRRRNKGVILAAITVVVALSIGAYLFFSGKAVSPDRTTRHAKQLAQVTEKAGPGLKSRQSGDVDQDEDERKTRRGPQSRTSREFSEGSIPDDRQLPDLEPSPRSSLPRDSEKSSWGDDEEEIGTATQWFEKGQALDDDSDAEMECYNKAIELDPKFAPAYYRLGAIYYRQAKYELADQQFAKFVEHASEADRETYDIYVYYSLSDVERLSGRVEEETVAEKVEEKPSSETEAETEAEAEAETESAGSEEPSAETSDEVMTVVRFSTVDGHVIVPVVVNDYFQANVMVDTGSGITIVSRSLARDLGLTEQGNHPITLKTIGKDVQGQLATLDSIQIGHLGRHGFPVAIADLPLGQEGRFDGILGMDFMNSYIIHIDNEQQKITLTTKAQ